MAVTATLCTGAFGQATICTTTYFRRLQLRTFKSELGRIMYRTLSDTKPSFPGATRHLKKIIEKRPPSFRHATDACHYEDHGKSLCSLGWTTLPTQSIARRSWMNDSYDLLNARDLAIAIGVSMPGRLRRPAICVQYQERHLQPEEMASVVLY
ncbi:hypothetical protein BDZ89DRAFT_1117773 [Hymenopellis radicata]|nr:hypothetical protein BDZ89DRAFT_1117773 [Hymenopellis radicata]